MPCRSGEDRAKLAASWVCLCSWEPLLLTGGLLKHRRAARVSQLVDREVEEGSWASGSPEGPEGLWATPSEPGGAPPMALEGGEGGLSGGGGQWSGWPGLSFPIWVRPRHSPPRGLVVVPPAERELNTPG